MRRTLLKRQHPIKRVRIARKQTKLRLLGVSSSSELKREIQGILRQIAIYRDGGCIFRHHPETGKCGPTKTNGELVLQFDHLNSRAHTISFADERLGICVCLRHHIYYKKQYPAQYEEIARKNIGKERCSLLDRVRADRTPHKLDLKLAKIGLEQVLQKTIAHETEKI